MILKTSGITCVSFLSIVIISQASAHDIEVGETDVNLYGFARLNATYDVGDVRQDARGLGNSMSFPNVAVDGEPTSSGGHTQMHAYQSRLGARAITPTEQGDILTVVEGDFWGGGGGSFRLRHAYGAWNGLLAGQTTTNFHVNVANTPVLDFLSPMGRGSTGRQAQLRYSIGDDIHIALEDPGGSASGSAFLTGDGIDNSRQDRLPVATARYQSGHGNANYAASAMIRHLSLNGSEDSDSTVGWGVALGGNYDLAEGTRVRALAVGGEGIGNYLKNAPAPAAYQDNGSLNTLRSWGGTVSLSQAVSSGHINLVHSYVTSDWNDAEGAGLNVEAQDDERQLTHLNYIWSSISPVTYGVEVARIQRKTLAGDEGSALRFQGSVSYHF